MAIHSTKVQSAINSTTNRSTRNTPAKLLFGFKPWSMADVALVSAIQETLDQVSLQEVRKIAKININDEQKKQKRAFDPKRFRLPEYRVGGVVMADSKSAPATGDSRKLNAKATIIRMIVMRSRIFVTWRRLRASERRRQWISLLRGSFLMLRRKTSKVALCC